MIPLIYFTIAVSVSPSTIGDYWFVMVAAFSVMAVSFVTATVLGCCFSLEKGDFETLRISSTFPNVVALPILIFPSLCEYSVVHEAFGTGEDATELYQKCVANSNTMIFLYFFIWSFLFWSLGYRNLMAVAHSNDDREQEVNNTDEPRHRTLVHSIWKGLKQTISSPGFIAMILGFVTGCIPQLQQALFSSGGALRFLGAALETLGIASNSMSTMVVAASLVSPREEEPSEQSNNDEEETSQEETHVEETQGEEIHEESPIMSDPNFGPHHLRRRSSIKRFQQSIRRGSARIVSTVPRSTPKMRRLLLWYTLSRLIVSPGIVVAVIVGLDYGGVLENVADLAKLVVIINAAVPGALIVAVLLQSKPELAEMAAVVAKVYLPSYLLSIVTIAAWTALGLWIALPDEKKR